VTSLSMLALLNAGVPVVPANRLKGHRRWRRGVLSVRRRRDFFSRRSREPKRMSLICELVWASPSISAHLREEGVRLRSTLHAAARTHGRGVMSTTRTLYLQTRAHRFSMVLIVVALKSTQALARTRGAEGGLPRGHAHTLLHLFCTFACTRHCATATYRNRAEEILHVRVAEDREGIVRSGLLTCRVGHGVQAFRLSVAASCPAASAPAYLRTACRDTACPSLRRALYTCCAA